MTEVPIKIRFSKSLNNLLPSRLIVVKPDNASDFQLYITDKSGNPFPLKDEGGVINSIINTDNNLVITGTEDKTINISPALLSVINSALQSGDNISELTNDAGYVTDLEEKVVNEIPTGVLNGVNSTFTTQFGVKPDSEEVYVNGNRQKKPDDYNISGQIINLTFSPQSTESILIDYIKL